MDVSSNPSPGNHPDHWKKAAWPWLQNNPPQRWSRSHCVARPERVYRSAPHLRSSSAACFTFRASEMVPGTVSRFDRFGGMGDRAEVCRARALECERAAARAHDAAVRRAYLDLARQWRETAEQAEVIEHRPGGMPKLLREEINDAVTRYFERSTATNASVDVAAMAREMAQSFVDMVVEQDEQIQPLLIAQMIAAMGDEYLERRALHPDGRRDH